MKSIYCNWAVHNLVGHPLMQIFSWLGMKDLAAKVHDATVPATPFIED